MKKFICILLSLVLTLGLSACGGKPSTMSEEMYNAGKNALKIVDDYIDNEIDYDTAFRKLNNTEELIDDIYEKCEKKDNGLPMLANESKVMYLTSLMQVALYKENYGSGTYTELLESRNDLAEVLNESKRKE